MSFFNFQQSNFKAKSQNMIFFTLEFLSLLIIRGLKLMNSVLVYVISVSETASYSATSDYLIVFQCIGKVPTFMKQHCSSVHHRIQKITSIFLSWPTYIHSSYSCPFNLRSTLILSCHLRMYGIPKNFCSAVRVTTVRQEGQPPRVPRSDIGRTEIVFKPSPLSGRNVRYNRK
jgi:hypothetical protein